MSTMLQRSFFLCFALVFLAGISPAEALSFPDTERTRYNDAFAYLSDRGVVRGYGDGSARPFFLVNRVEALKVLLDLQPKYAQRVQWFTAHPSRLSLFVDTQQGAWYTPYLEAAFEAGIITGYRDRTFRPGNPLKTEEAITLLVRAYGQDTGRVTAGADGWYRADLDLAIRKNLIAADETIYLGDNVTRGQFFDMIYRMDSIRRQNIASFISPDGKVRTASLTLRPSPIMPSPGAVAGMSFAISVPALGIDGLAVNHPAESFTSKGLLAPLKYGLGHLFSYPGGGGKIMIYGHSSGYAWDVSKYTKIFRRVNELKAGDKVYVTYNGKSFTYEVTFQQEISPSDMRPFTGRGEELILYTCWPPDSIQKRLIIHAKPLL